MTQDERGAQVKSGQHAVQQRDTTVVDMHEENKNAVVDTEMTSTAPATNNTGCFLSHPHAFWHVNLNDNIKT